MIKAEDTLMAVPLRTASPSTCWILIGHTLYNDDNEAPGGLGPG